MVKQDLIDRSPVRFFEKSLNGGVVAGEVGVIASKKGLGKTSVLVQIGLDLLLQEKQVIHVSFNQHSDYVMTWYEDIFDETAKKKNLDKAGDVKGDLVRNRIVLNFNQDLVTTAQMAKTIKALGEGGIKADTLIIDGFDFTRANIRDLEEMKAFAKDACLSVWYSCDADVIAEKAVYPAVLLPLVDAFDVIIFLEQKTDAIHLKVLKEHKNGAKETDLKLDAKTLLIAEK